MMPPLFYMIKWKNTACVFPYYLDFILTKSTLLKQSYIESNNTTQTDKVHMTTESTAALKNILMNTKSKILRYSQKCQKVQK